MGPFPCVAVLGDSASVGFGTRGRSYSVLLGEMLRAERVEVVASLGKTTREMLEEWPAVALLHPDVVIVQGGMADSLLHPNVRTQGLIDRLTPSKWHGFNGLERRAFFSGDRAAQARQRVSNEI